MLLGVHLHVLILLHQALRNHPQLAAAALTSVPRAATADARATPSLELHTRLVSRVLQRVALELQ